MSNGLAIAGVTALLKKAIETNLKTYNLEGPLDGDPAVKTTPPKDPVDAASQVHIFLYRAKENPSMRNNAMPAYSGTGERIENLPLALDLYYCLTALGKADYHSETLLGASMQAFHENATFSHAQIREILDDVSLNDLNLKDTLLADQYERIRIVPHNVTEDEHFRIWSSFQTAYRPSVLYKVSVVLITSQKNTAGGPPVLQRILGSVPNLLPPYPTLYAIDYLANQKSAVLGQTITLTGLNLSGADSSIQINHLQSGQNKTIAPGQISDNSVEFSLPDESDTVPAGDYTVTYSVKRDGEDFSRVSKLDGLKVAPTVTNISSNKVENGIYDIDLEFKPKLRPGQTLSLTIGSEQMLAAPIEAATSSVSFKKQSLSAGSYLYHLYIDQVSSHYIDMTKTPPEFKADQVVILA